MTESFDVPALACFGDTPIEVFEMSAVGSDLSGISYNYETGTFFAVNNGDAKVYEIAADRTTKVQEWNVKPEGIADPESVSFMGGRKVAVTDENPSEVYTMLLNSDGTISEKTKVSTVLTPAAGNNLGYEGVAWMKTANKFIAVVEANPPRIVSIAGTNGVITTVAANLETSNGIKSVGALTRGGSNEAEVFIIGKAPVEHTGIHRVRLSDGVITDKYAGAVCDMSQPEGVTFYKKDSDIYMLVVGEPTQARLFKAERACTKALNSTTGTLKECPAKVLTTPKCEKTYADGGCPYTRCDKGDTDHTKICVEGNTCTLEQCFQHCKDSNFAAPHTNKTCTHWAWDKFESECYIFHGCKNEKFDNEYTQYAMVDDTCEKTRAEAPKGCQERRCKKSTNKNEKVCDKDNAAPTGSCTLDVCEQKCKDYSNFTCGFFAHESAENECYVFETCNDEGNEPGYNLYARVDPTCDKNRSQGGCDLRRCNKDVTKHNKICDDSSMTCTEEECQNYCANYTGWGKEPADWCTYYAYDKADKECYLFNGCIGEGFNDDYKLFVMGYEERQALNQTKAPTEAPTAAPAASAATIPTASVVCVGLLAARLLL